MIYAHNQKIDVPVYQFESDVAYQTVRRPTAFEKSLLQLFAKYSQELGEQTLDDVAKKLKLCATFFVDALNYLQEFGAVELLYGYSIEDGATVKCNSILITQEGREFLAKNALPSRSKNVAKTNYYHPFTSALVEKNKVRTDTDVGVAKLPASMDLGVDLRSVEPLLEEKIHKLWESKANERVESISSRQKGQIWDRKAYKVEIDHNGNVSVESKDSEFSAWIDGAKSEFLWANVVSPVFTINSERERIRVHWDQVANIAPVDKVKEVIKQTKLTYLLTLKANTSTDAPTVLINNEDGIKLAGNMLILPSLPIELSTGANAFLVDNSQQGFEVKTGLCETFFAGQPREVELAVVEKNDGIKDQLEHFLLTSEDINVIIFSSLIDSQQAIERLPKAHMPDVAKYFEKMQPFVPNLHADGFKEKVKPLRNKEEVNAYVDLFCEQSLKLDSLTNECLTDVINSAINRTEVIEGLSISSLVTDISTKLTALKNKTSQDLITLKNFDLLKLNVPRYQLLTELHGLCDALLKQLPESVVKDSALSSLSCQINKAVAHFKASYADPQDHNKRIVVLDTNCLMHQLAILDKIKPSDEIVLPTTVLEELDGLKDDKIKDEWTDKAKKARAAIDRLNSFDNYEKPHLNLLEISEKDASDLKILSVSAYYRLCSSTLVTDDKNLINMANAEGIQAQSTQDYLAGSSKKKSKKGRRK